jgi:NAD(P)-dependent dehydrogenase (short-subunit alcohol dehydrogenase family)
LPTVLITGANRGLGLEFSRQYAAEGWHVLGTCRDPKKAPAVKGNVAFHKLDVADPKGPGRLAAALKSEAVDLLINNAGIYGGKGGVGGTDYDEWAQVLAVNTIAPHRVTSALMPHLLRGEGKQVVVISSGLGSIADNTSGESVAYRSSKAAVNQVVRTLAAELKPWNIVVIALSPGWVRTDMGGKKAPLAPKESISGMRRVIAGLKSSDSGRFLRYNGGEFPW